MTAQKALQKDRPNPHLDTPARSVTKNTKKFNDGALLK
jgi:hypothetical protein